MTYVYKQTHFNKRSSAASGNFRKSGQKADVCPMRVIEDKESLSLSITYATETTDSLVMGHGKGAPETYIISSVLPVPEVVVTGEKNPKPSRRQANQTHTET